MKSPVNHFALEEFLPYRLSLLTNTVSRELAASYREEHDITIIEWRVLAVLGRFPGLTAKKIVDRTAMDKVAISRAVKTLMDKNLLTRKVDPEDRRRQQLFLTPDKGQLVLEDILPRARKLESTLLDTLTREEQVQLNHLLSRLQTAAENL